MATFSTIKKSQLEGTHRLDAEYYQPEYLELQKNINRTGSSKLWRNIEGKFITGPFGSEFNTENYVTNGKYRYVRGKDVKDFFLMDEDNVYVPNEDYERLKKYSLDEGDILISVVGTPGITSIVDKAIPPAIFSCKSTVYRSKTLSPYYFIAYLNSSYGRRLLERSVRGALQTGLNIDDLKNLPIYIPSNDDQNSIANIIIQAKTTHDNSRSLYSQAENLLLEELGLKDFESKDDLSWVVNLYEIQSAHRADAEYFQPKYAKTMSLIRANGGAVLDDLVTIKKGIEPGSEAYQEEGALFVRVSSVSKHGIENKDQKYLSEKLYKELKNNFEPKVGEILLTKDATPGVAHVLKGPIEGIISGGILRLKVKEDTNPEYLALCINSVIGQAQVERDAGGSVIAHWKPDQVKNLLIPILPKSTQEKIADLVRQSHEARKKSKQLLEEAKHKVEELIESNVK